MIPFASDYFLHIVLSVPLFLSARAPEFDLSELENLFAAAAPKSENAAKSNRSALGPKSDKVQLVIYLCISSVMFLIYTAFNSFYFCCELLRVLLVL